MAEEFGASARLIDVSNATGCPVPGEHTVLAASSKRPPCSSMKKWTIPGRPTSAPTSRDKPPIWEQVSHLCLSGDRAESGWCGVRMG